MTIIILYYNGIRASRVRTKQLTPAPQRVVPGWYDKDYG